MGRLQRFSEIGHRGHWQVAHKRSFMCHLSVSLVPNLGKMLQSPQRDLAPWTITLTITDWLSLYFLFYNKPHCWKENVSQGQRFSGRTQKKETFQKPIKEIEFASKIVLTYCETKIVLVIENVFCKLFTLSLAYLKSFSWFPKQYFQTVIKGQHSFWNRIHTTFKSDTGRIH